MMLLLLLLLAVAAGERIGIAINSDGDGSSLERVRFALSSEGWASPSNVNKSGLVVSNVVVYSSSHRRSSSRGWLPWGTTGTCVLVVPSPEDRVLTFGRMLETFDTYWYVSTEDDAWWNLAATAEMIRDFRRLPGGDDPANPMFVAVGWYQYEAYGAFFLLNRPLLSMFSNQTLLDGCRADLLKRRRQPDFDDTLIAHCLFHYFPRKTRAVFVGQHYWPLYAKSRRPKRFWYNGPRGWNYSRRVPDLLAEMTDLEKRDLAGVHHVTTDDMFRLEHREDDDALSFGSETPTLPPPGDLQCAAWINPQAAHAADPSTLCDVGLDDCAASFSQQQTE